MLALLLPYHLLKNHLAQQLKQLKQLEKQQQRKQQLEQLKMQLDY
jgi:hypothetical protein